MARSQAVIAPAPPSPVEAQAPIWPLGAVRAGWAIVVIGTLLRIRLYIADRSLWLDEAALGLNVLRRSFRGLCQPLDRNQGAPILFLWLQKAATLMFGNSERSFRLVPLIGGVAILVLVFRFSIRYLPPLTGLIALTIVAVAKDLLRF